MTTKQEIGQEFVKHHGVKGQKWGVRRAQRQDKKFTKRANDVVTKINIHNAANKVWAPELDRINAKYDKAANDGTLLKTDHPTTKRYLRETMDSYVVALNKVANSQTSKTGNLRYSVHQNDYDTLGFTVTAESVTHADNSFRVNFVKDEKGLVTNFARAEMKQAEEFITKFLEHHGVKGMQWGVRREELRSSRRGVQAARVEKRGVQELERRVSRKPTPIQVTDTIGKSSFSKTKIKAVGGEDHHAHDDAIKVAVSRQKLKRSGIHTLSNAELQEMNNRMNLEAQVYSLNSKRKKSVGQGFVDMHLAKAKQDPFGTIMKSHKINRVVRRAASTVAVAAVL